MTEQRIATIQPFVQCCTQHEPCGRIISHTGHVAIVIRYAIYVDGAIVKLADDLPEAREYIALKGLLYAA